MRAHLIERDARLALLLALPPVFYAALLTTEGDLRPEHVIIAALSLALALIGPRTRRFLYGVLPFTVLFLLYDGMRYVRDLGLSPARILTCNLHAAELSLFGVHTSSGLIAPGDFFAIHHHPIVDLICAVPYGAYIPLMIALWLYLYATDLVAARRFAWIALITHLFGFVTYHLVPAAPPWYVRRFGCEVLLSTHQSPAALARVDAMLGISYFHALYGRGSAVFGALPSLHVTYPLYGLFVTFRRVRLSFWLAQLAYALLMAFAAVYLGHHYILDILLGYAYATVALLLVNRYLSVAGPLAREPSSEQRPTLGRSPRPSPLR